MKDVIIIRISTFTGRYYNVDRSIVATKPVDPTQPLYHAVQRGQIANNVIRIEVDAHLASGGSD